MRYLDIARKVEARLRDKEAPAPPAPIRAMVAGCPTCGATAEELALVRRRRALDEALRALEVHYAACDTCTTMGPWCEEGKRLREAHLDAWLGWAAWRTDAR